MNRMLLAIGALVLLTACASPAERMTVEQVSSLTDVQLCQINNGYRPEPKVLTEIGSRNLNCDPAVTQCMAQGVRKDNPLMPLCVSSVYAQWRADYYAAAENARLDYETYTLGTKANTQHILINR